MAFPFSIMCNNYDLMVFVYVSIQLLNDWFVPGTYMSVKRDITYEII